MSKSIKITAVKLSHADLWPHTEIRTDTSTDTHDSLLNTGVKIYCTTLMNVVNYSELLTLKFHYYFPTDELFESYKNITYTCIPKWINEFSPEDLAAYYAANHITITIEEISNPDLTGYELQETHYNSYQDLNRFK